MSAFNTYFVDTIKNRYAKFDGRARRSEYWYFTLFNVLISIAFTAVSMGFASAGIGTGATVISGLSLLVSLGLLIPGLALAVRRLHDVNKSGWWLLIGLIPLLGAIALLVFFCTEGNSGDNQFGSDPKNGQSFNSDSSLIDTNIV